MTVDESWMANDTFTNVGRPIFFGKVEVPQPRELSWFGMDWDGDGVRDMLNTGEKTSAVWDKTSFQPFLQFFVDLNKGSRVRRAETTILTTAIKNYIRKNTPFIS